MIKSGSIRKILFNTSNANKNSAYLTNTALYISLLITLIFSLLYFNVGINTGGDDVGYVLRARRFWEQGLFPDFQGPLYPVILAPFYGLTKGNLLLLRVISIPMFLGSIFFIFKTYKAILPPQPFFILLLVLSINFYWLTYSSLTYSEALYNFIQFGIIYFFYRRFIESEATIKDVILLAFLGILLMKTRSVGATIIATIFIFFLIHRHWKKLLQFFLISLLFIVIWDSITYFLLEDNSSILTSQITGLLQKNPYDPTQGLTGFKLLIERLFYNFNEYVSLHIFQLLGIRGTGMIKANWVFTFLMALFIIAAIFFNRGRNNMIRFSLIYLLLGMLVVFMTPKMWSQMRFIQPYIPLIYIVLLNEVNILSKKRLSWLPTALLSLLFFLQLGHAVHYIKDNNTKIQAYMQGDKYSDQTPDWKNYLNACEWIGKNLSEEEGRIACRKPHIAAMVSGQDNFFGIYYVPNYRLSELSHKLEDSAENFIVIDIDRFYKHPVPERITTAMMQSFAGPIWKNSGNTNLILFQIEEEEIFNTIVSVNNTLDFIIPIQTLLDDKEYSVSFADSLLLRLKQNNVAYLMRANLRVYPEEKSDEVLSSVHNYMITINIKYPNIFEPVFQSGSDIDEPTTIFKIHYPGDRESPEQDKEEPAILAKDNFERMCDWAVNNTQKEANILCRSDDGAFNEKVPERILILNSIPTMNYTEFIKTYLTENNRYLIMNPVNFDLEKIENNLITELNLSSHGLIYIGNNILRLHKIESPGLYNRLIEDEYLRNYLTKLESIANLPKDAEDSFRFFEPSYILTRLFNTNIHYIIADDIAPANSQNYIKELISFIITKFPDAFHEVKSFGVEGTDKTTLYKINYQVLN